MIGKSVSERDHGRDDAVTALRAVLGSFFERIALLGQPLVGSVLEFVRVVRSRSLSVYIRAHYDYYKTKHPPEQCHAEILSR